MEKQTFDIGRVIKEKLKEKKCSIAWLANEISYDRSNLYKLLEHPHISPERLRQISQALEHDFFKHYSDDLQMFMEK